MFHGFPSNQKTGGPEVGNLPQMGARCAAQTSETEPVLYNLKTEFLVLYLEFHDLIKNNKKPLKVYVMTRIRHGVIYTIIVSVSYHQPVERLTVPRSRFAKISQTAHVLMGNNANFTIISHQRTSI